MKKVWIGILLVMLLALTGCSGTAALTEEQNSLIAEYMAGSLLKYDKNNDEALIYEPVPTPSPTPEPSAVPNKDTAVTPKPSESGAPSGSGNGNKEDKSPVYSDINEVYDKKNFDITYDSYKLYDSYPENPEKLGFSVDAAKGNKLVIIKFNVKNLSDKKKSINLLKDSMKYQLDVNIENIYYKPMVTLLLNDLQFLDIEIAGNKTETAVIAFQIKDTPVKKMNLFVTREDKTAIIKLK